MDSYYAPETEAQGHCNPASMRGSNERARQTKARNSSEKITPPRPSSTRAQQVNHTASLANRYSSSTADFANDLLSPETAGPADNLPPSSPMPQFSNRADNDYYPPIFFSNRVGNDTIPPLSTARLAMVIILLLATIFLDSTLNANYGFSSSINYS